jgi:transglutaminase-like putative cysteine protease
MSDADLSQYLTPTAYIDSDHPEVIAKAAELIKDCRTEREKVEKIYYFVRELPYDILSAFRYLAQGRRQASDVLAAGTAFCMGKASAFVALCRAGGIPARIGFQQLHCPDKPFMSEEVRELWGDRKLPWHSLGEAHVDGRWLRLDATIHSALANAKGMPYTREFDGASDIPSVEGPVLKELDSYSDYPKDVADWYEAMAKEVVRAVEAKTTRDAVANNDALWTGPRRAI